MEDIDTVQVVELRTTLSDAATKILLQFMAENSKNVGKTYALKNKAKLWKMGSQVLEENGYAYTSNQIETKFRALERQYKKKLLNNKQTGRGRMNCAYETELDEIFKEKRGIYPEYTLEADAVVEEVESAPNSPLTTSCSQSGSPSQEHVEPQRKKIKKGQTQLVQALEAAAANRQKEHEELMAFLKQREEQKEKRAKEKQEFLLKLFKKD